ncbi:DUF2683 family protein [Sphingobacterium faecium]|uniref:DUF2683 family protein n=1 Tax=Sphingobacterium faecium TaxID=34087 RepID=UPI0024692D76|nr:DUF2683 family protein [Sphingobacterium faecium]MDH5828836.1 hypothetical protein [Sphingobacterium faecium]WGQ17033.1 hypothetical protein QG727_22930 [Sphingobacterium faecium]
MKTITVSEFRKNIKKYAEMASTEKVIVNRGEGKAFLVVPVEAVEDSGYNPEFVQRVLKAEQDIANGEFVEIKDVKNLWADIN